MPEETLTIKASKKILLILIKGKISLFSFQGCLKKDLFLVGHSEKQMPLKVPLYFVVHFKCSLSALKELLINSSDSHCLRKA